MSRSDELLDRAQTLLERLEAAFNPVGNNQDWSYKRLHHGEGVEEKISLSERFGLWLSFYPFNQEQYLRIVDHWLEKLDSKTTADEQTRTAALQWALQRGSRSGRVAWQFARDWAGRSSCST